MPDPLVSEALEQAERSEPAIKAAAFLHLARVIAAEDHAKAAHLFDQPQAILAALPLNHRMGLDDEVVRLAAAVDPERVRQLLDSQPGSRFRLHASGATLIQVMLEHGHSEEAVCLSSDPSAITPYPLTFPRRPPPSR